LSEEQVNEEVTEEVSEEGGAERRQHARFSVNWAGRIMLSDRSMYKIIVVDVSSGGVAIRFDRVLSKETPVNIEFFASVGKKSQRVRAKTIVCHNTMLSNGEARLGLRFTQVGKADLHGLSNMLQQLTDQQG